MQGIDLVTVLASCRSEEFERQLALLTSLSQDALVVAEQWIGDYLGPPKIFKRYLCMTGWRLLTIAETSSKARIRMLTSESVTLDKIVSW